MTAFIVHRETARLPSENFPATLLTDDQGAGHPITISLAYHEGVLHEVSFVSRGKVGHGMDLLLADLGIRLSRAIQRRHPDTGEVMP